MSDVPLKTAKKFVLSYNLKGKAEHPELLEKILGQNLKTI